MIAEREGVHCTSTLKLVKRRPSLASSSSRGVGAPLMIPPPLKPGSPQPKLSMKTRTMFGLSWANPAAGASSTENASTSRWRLFTRSIPFVRSKGTATKPRRPGPLAANPAAYRLRAPEKSAESGRSVEWVAGQLGISSPELTLRVYGRLTGGAPDAAMNTGPRPVGYGQSVGAGSGWARSGSP
jgi:hypothetical protein